MSRTTSPRKTKQSAVAARPAPEAMDDAVGNALVAAKVVETRYLPSLSDPADTINPFWTWGYKVTITNRLAQPITILERHWLIRPTGRREQKTDGWGIGGEEFIVPAGESRSYISGVPLPSREGGAMKGSFLARAQDGSRIKIDVPEFPLAGNDNHEATRLVAKSPADTRQLNRALDLYVRQCRTEALARLDTNDLPASLCWAFQRFCLGQDKTAAFNSKKKGEISKLEVGQALKVLVEVKDDIEYNDILIFGHSFDELRVQLLYSQKEEELVQEPLRKYLAAKKVPVNMRTELAADIERLVAAKLGAAKPRQKWDERGKYADLKDLSAPEFLKRVYSDVIAPDGTIEKELVRKVDKTLMATVDAYIGKREKREQDAGDAAGLRFVARSTRPKGVAHG